MMIKQITNHIPKKSMLLVAGVLVLLSGLAIGAVSYIWEQSDRATEFLRAGDKEYAAGNWDEALRLYNEAALIKENSNEIRNKIKITEDKLKKGETPTAKSPKSNQTANPSSPSTATSNTPATSPLSESSQKPGGAVEIPNLVGLTKTEAEQLLLSKKIRYQFFIEPSDAEADKVFKQDKEPGKPYQQGDRITFYVSRGK
ncbi:PASTA domain-containing protein [Effusibacillus consociatus]|uniref:PASTA domain-containing protein n=1 Tax=Effusibacillus consociatus TaxID=1117041 RepID=A0ABV9PXU5_9BACL